MFKNDMNASEKDLYGGLQVQYPPNPSIQGNSAYIPGNPDFDPSKDVPQARGCDTMFDIISSDY
jgi:hypothetical protein